MAIYLQSSLVCEDVLTNPAGRLTLYNVSFTLFADAWPALFPRLVVVNTWRTDEVGEHVDERVSVLAPDGSTSVADGLASFDVPPQAEHSQISAFRGVTFPVPGVYRVQVWRNGEMAMTYPLTLVDVGTTEEEGV